jgi:hypothetical protein
MDDRKNYKPEWAAYWLALTGFLQALQHTFTVTLKNQ